MSAVIEVLVADNHPAAREGVLAFLAMNQRLKVVGMASNGEEALRKALELGPDVVLLDISMPGQKGLATTEALRLQAPHIKVVVFSVYENQECVLRALQAGAHGYVSKRALPDELSQAIETVYSGQSFVSPRVANAAIDEFVQNGRTGRLPSHLSNREREVLVCIASGLKNRQIAAELNIAARTIETHRERVMRRLNIHCVPGLTKFALATGLVALEANAPVRVQFT
jgi:two-component system response regulator NreC